MGFLPGPLLSFLMETLQFYVPGRVPSLSDWALNCGGSTLGDEPAYKDIPITADAIADAWTKVRTAR